MSILQILQHRQPTRLRALINLSAITWALGCGLLAAEVGTDIQGSARRTLSLDGTWQTADGGMDQPPSRFERSVAVPGLIDSAMPAFEDVGVKSSKRDAFWYRRTFRLDAAIPAVAQLKVHKAMFGTRVILNGVQLGDHLPCFTPGYFDAKPGLKEGDNELLIRVGAFRDSLPKVVPTGWDNEKKKYIPGIYDSVELILSDTPSIARIQAVPDIDKQTVTLHAWVRRAGAPTAAKIRIVVREAISGRIAGQGECEVKEAADGAEMTGQVTLSLLGCRLWSPEDPFLYEVEARSTGDSLKNRFGMRSFKFDQATGRALLNGKPYFLRGSNITLYRFFEDPERNSLPWNEQWVRRLHQKVKGMHWNSLRYCIGFPPEFWYRIADEEGILIQDEFPIWKMDPKPDDFDPNELAKQYTEWMQERWNHPSVVIWDACNETPVQARTGEAIQRVRSLDFSNRPWDNGWAPPQAPGDVFESHPYHFCDANFKLSDIAKDSGVPDGNVGINNTDRNPIIINEYGWLWLNRDGTPTTLTRELYKNLLGPNSTPAERQHLYARYTAAETEFWRSHRACAGVLDFCVLGYSRADGQTSDHWIDVEKLTCEPEFYKYVRDAFAPVGLMIDAWAESYSSGKQQEFPVVVINDLYERWKGVVRFRLICEGKTVEEKMQNCEVAPLGDLRITFKMGIPGKSAKYQIEATLLKPGAEAVSSWRDFITMTEEECLARFGIAVGKSATASSSLNHSGATSPMAAFDGKTDTRWSSEFSSPQWIAVDLGKTEKIARARLVWEGAYAKSFVIEVSRDGQKWTEVYQADNGKGGTEEIAFAPVEARWVRMTGKQRATQFGFSLWEFGVFRSP